MAIFVMVTIQGCFFVESEKGEPIKPTQMPTSVVVILPVATAADKHSVSPSP